MERKIKFRVWNGEKFVHNLTINPNGYEYWTLKGMVPIDIEKIQQYTGLNDKNNNEIFEGDIIKVDRYHTISKQVFPNSSFKVDIVEDNVQFGEVYWDNNFCGFSIQYYLYDDTESLGNYSDNRIEIIGNIYETPQLLKK